jgi:hypothetical protein
MTNIRGLISTHNKFLASKLWSDIFEMKDVFPVSFDNTDRSYYESHYGPSRLLQITGGGENIEELYSFHCNNLLEIFEKISKNEFLTNRQGLCVTVFKDS